MIRFTELERAQGVVRARVEGSLTAVALQVVREALARCRNDGASTVILEADGILLVDRLAMRDWAAILPEGLAVRLTTSRRSLLQLLSSYGVQIEFVPLAGGDPHPLEGGH